MKRYKILHETSYQFSGAVELLPHTLLLRPREGHELRIENSVLAIDPEPVLRWQRSVEDNSVATAHFTGSTQQLLITSEVIIQQYDQAPFDFLVADYAVDYPFSYNDEDRQLLAPYLEPVCAEGSALSEWVSSVWDGEVIQSFALLLRLNQRIYQALSYQIREEEGVQDPQQTLATGAGSCRDFAALFMAAARQLGLAARFVSGYLYCPNNSEMAGSTHAWAEVFLPGAGWKGFDPTSGCVVGPEHIAVAVARLPESVPPIAGAFNGPPGASMAVSVWVTELRDPS